MLRELFRLPYRQNDGLGRALAMLLGADFAILDFAPLIKRAAKLGVSIDVSQASGPIDVVVDSTGQVRQHGVGKRRKPHLAVDVDSREIVAKALEHHGVP